MPVLLILGLAAGPLVGLLRGGSLFRLGELRGYWFAILSFALDVLLRRMPGIAFWPKAAITTACYLCVLIFVFKNRNSRTATVLLSAGTLCNYAVKAANAFRMPVSVKAIIVFSGISDASVRASRPDYFIAENGAKLLPLGDVIYIPFPWQKAFYSVGDLLIAAGVFWLIVVVMGKKTDAAVLESAAPAEPDIAAESTANEEKNDSEQDGN